MYGKKYLQKKDRKKIFLVSFNASEEIIRFGSKSVTPWHARICTKTLRYGSEHWYPVYKYGTRYTVALHMCRKAYAR